MEILARSGSQTELSLGKKCITNFFYEPQESIGNLRKPWLGGDGEKELEQTWARLCQTVKNASCGMVGFRKVIETPSDDTAFSAVRVHTLSRSTLLLSLPGLLPAATSFRSIGGRRNGPLVKRGNFHSPLLFLLFHFSTTSATTLFLPFPFFFHFPSSS